MGGIRRGRAATLCLLGAMAGMQLLALPAGAQQAGSGAGSLAAPANSVTITSKRATKDSSEFLAADSRVLGRKFASSCNYMTAYNPVDDDVYIDYILHFHGYSNELNLVRDGSPLGDASGTSGVIRDNAPLGDASGGAATPDLLNQSPGPHSDASRCNNADRAFAAGRNRIARKDRTLATALTAYDRADYAEAMSQFKENYRKLGNDFSALMLGRMYLEGKGTPVNVGEGVAWLRKVVEARFAPQDRMQFDPKNPQFMSTRAEAAMILARIYMLGNGLPKDLRQARDYYELAADAGYAPAAGMLGVGYLSGFGGDKNPSRAVKYLKQAGEAGYAPALLQLGKAYYSGNGVEKDWKMAGAYYTAAAREGNAEAQLAAARMYDFGESVKPDQQRAIFYYKEAALKGLPDAQNALAVYFYKGEVVAQNLATARKLFDAAAMQAQPEAMYNLAVMLRNGEGGPKDLAMAYVWFSLAKAARHADAAMALAEVQPELSKAELDKAEAILRPTAGAPRK